MWRCVSSTRCDIAISQYHTATNPYFAISKSKTVLKMVFFINCQKDTLAIIYNDGLNNDVLINSGVDQVRKLVKADKCCLLFLVLIDRTAHIV